MNAKLKHIHEFFLTFHPLQACSGIEDVGVAFTYLEAANWNLLDALQVVMPQEATPATPTQPPPLQAVSQVGVREENSAKGGGD